MCIENFGLNIGLAFAEMERVFATAAHFVPPAMLACMCVRAVHVDIFLNETGVYLPTHKQKCFIQPKMSAIMDDFLGGTTAQLAMLMDFKVLQPGHCQLIE